MYLEVVKPGIFTSLQSLESNGFRAMGMGPGGVMDEYAATMANRLVQNPNDTEVLEMHFPAPELFFPQQTLIAITGANFNAVNNGQTLQNWQTHFMEAGTGIRFSGIISGYRAYLSVRGGFGKGASKPALPERTTPLKKGDRLTLNKPCDISTGTYEAAILPAQYSGVYKNDGVLYCIAGPEWELLSETEKIQLTSQPFIISPQSNRMGCRLDGTPIQHKQKTMLSSATDNGTVQLLPNGLPVILTAGHQTTGGYPRVLSVIAPSRSVLAQLSPGTSIRFCIISLPKATEKLISWNQLLFSKAI